MLSILVIALCIAQAQVKPFFTPRQASPVAAVIMSGEYFGVTYANGPKAPELRKVFFVSESIKMQIVLSNPDSADHTIIPGGATDVFVIEVARNGVSISDRPTVQEGRFLNASGEMSPFSLTQVTTLRNREKVEWRAEFDGHLPPGMYQVHLVMDVKDESGRPVIPHSPYEFEVRPRSSDAETELARRDAWREYLHTDVQSLQRAEAALQRLLHLHPLSYEACLIEGRISERKGDRVKADEALKRTAEILRNGHDKLLLKFKTQSEVREILRGVEASIRQQSEYFCKKGGQHASRCSRITRCSLLRPGSKRCDGSGPTGCACSERQASRC
jgi:hypothetical protein